MGKKLLIGALVAVVVLFVVAVGFGTTAEEGDAGGDQDGPVGALLDRFRNQSAVAPDELSGECVPDTGPAVPQSDGVLTVSGSCALRVGVSENRIRLLRLSALDPIVVSALTPGENPREVKSRLPKGDKTDLEVAVEKEGTTVAVFCAGFGPCRLQLRGDG